MGKYRFKLSDMIPNAWFHKLKYTTSTTKNQTFMQKPKKNNHAITKSPTYYSSLSSSSGGAHHQRKSYHFARDLPPTPDNNSASQLSESPRKSIRKRISLKKNRPLIRSATSARLLSSASVSADCSCRASLEGNQNYPHIDSSYSEDDYSVFPEMWSENGDKPIHKIVSSCHCRAKSDIPIGMTMSQDSKCENFDPVSQFKLKPIITKSNKLMKIDREVCKTRMVSARNDERISNSSSKEQKSKNSVKKLSYNINSTGLKLKTDSPRTASKRFLQVHHRKSASSGGARRSLAESFAVVKTSQDPHKDFKDSMVEMIIENNIKTSKDMEDLLACYLSLNSDKYHGLIIRAFKQIWFEITDIKFKNMKHFSEGS